MSAVAKRDETVIRFSRRELELVRDALQFLPVAESFDDRLLVAGMQDMLTRAVGERGRHNCGDDELPTAPC